MKNFKYLTVLCLVMLNGAMLCLSGCHQESSEKKEEKKSENRQVSATITPPGSTASSNPHSLRNPDPNFQTFFDAIVVADLTDLFQGTGPFTAFVPTNAAFEKLGKNKLELLFKPENKDQLTSLLIYHIVPGKYLAKSLKSTELKTVNGKNIAVSVDNGEIHINKAKVLRTDIVGPNGVIHEIDTVLEP